MDWQGPSEVDILVEVLAILDILKQKEDKYSTKETKIPFNNEGKIYLYSF